MHDISLTQTSKLVNSKRGQREEREGEGGGGWSGGQRGYSHAKGGEVSSVEHAVEGGAGAWQGHRHSVRCHRGTLNPLVFISSLLFSSLLFLFFLFFFLSLLLSSLFFLLFLGGNSCILVGVGEGVAEVEVVLEVVEPDTGAAEVAEVFEVTDADADADTEAPETETGAEEVAEETDEGLEVVVEETEEGLEVVAEATVAAEVRVEAAAGKYIS